MVALLEGRVSREPGSWGGAAAMSSSSLLLESWQPMSMRSDLEFESRTHQLSDLTLSINCSPHPSCANDPILISRSGAWLSHTQSKTIHVHRRSALPPSRRCFARNTLPSPTLRICQKTKTHFGMHCDRSMPRLLNDLPRLIHHGTDTRLH